MAQFYRAPAHLDNAGWGLEMEQGEGHEGCYDDFIMIFGRYESYGRTLHSDKYTTVFSGPVVLLRVELGVLSKGRLGPVELVSE